MDAQLLEKLDGCRYKYLLWQTVGYALLFAGVISGPYLTGKAAIIVMAVITGLGTGVFLVSTFKSNRNQRQINSDPDLRAALNNELVVLYGYKSLKWAFFATLITAVILFFLSKWWLEAMTTSLVCLIVIYIAIMALKISLLIYLRK